MTHSAPPDGPPRGDDGGARAAPQASTQFARGALWTLGAQGVNLGSMLAVYSLMAREFHSVAAMGEFGLARSATLALTYASGVGLRTILISRIGETPGATGLLFPTAQSVRLLLLLACLPILAVMMAAGGWGVSHLTMGLSGLVAVTQQNTDLPTAALLGHKRFRLANGIQILDRLFLLGCVWIALKVEPTVDAACLGMLAANLLRIACASAAARGTVVTRLRPGWSSPVARELLRRSMPLGLSMILVAIYARLGFHVMTALGTAMYEIGLFTAAINIIGQLTVLPTTVGLTALPIFSSLWETDRAAADRFHQRLLQLAVLGGTCLSAGLAVVSEPLLIVLLGRDYTAADPALRLLLLSAPLSFASTVHRFLLVPLGRERADLATVALGFAVHLAVALPLVEPWGAAGAAVGYSAGEIVICVVRFALVTRTMESRVAWRPLLVPALCVASVPVLDEALRRLGAPALTRTIVCVALLVVLSLRLLPLRSELRRLLSRRTAEAAPLRTAAPAAAERRSAA